MRGGVEKERENWRGRRRGGVERELERYVISLSANGL